VLSSSPFGAAQEEQMDGRRGRATPLGAGCAWDGLMERNQPPCPEPHRQAMPGAMDRTVGSVSVQGHVAAGGGCDSRRATENYGKSMDRNRMPAARQVRPLCQEPMELADEAEHRSRRHLESGLTFRLMVRKDVLIRPTGGVAETTMDIMRLIVDCMNPDPANRSDFSSLVREWICF
jgi:hypothetical protein